MREELSWVLVSWLGQVLYAESGAVETDLPPQTGCQGFSSGAQLRGTVVSDPRNEELKRLDFHPTHNLDLLNHLSIDKIVRFEVWFNIKKTSVWYISVGDEVVCPEVDGRAAENLPVNMVS